MARVSQVTITRSQTINLGNFESHRIEISKTVELDKGDSPADYQDKLLEKTLKDLLKEEDRVRKTYAKKSKSK